MKGRLITILSLAAVMLVTAPGCFWDSNEIPECDGAASDQRGSFMAVLAGFPVRVLVDSRFTEEEKDGIRMAAAQWNAVSQQLIHTDVFSLESFTPSAQLLAMDMTDCVRPFGGERVFRILRETSDEHWQQMKLMSDNPGVTLQCTFNGRITQQVVYLYPKLTAAGQFSSVAVHELGHAIGLDHSCLEGAGRADYRGCDGLDHSHPYRQAVMYPSIGGFRGKLEIKDSPRLNDRHRARCVLEK